MLSTEDLYRQQCLQYPGVNSEGKLKRGKTSDGVGEDELPTRADCQVRGKKNSEKTQAVEATSGFPEK